MKISDSLNKANGLGVAAPKARAAKAEDKAGADKIASDSVTISSEAQALSSQNSGNQVFDSKKVEEIKAAIASGRFQVDAGKIADGLIDTVKDLISARKG
ncbi:flagellar biosynthesis anti-sigma factor FlgM [Noviherbaspirillum autotrophicum]|jgi:negative regulator of flagellin synthesis FlgM|uniref:Negative regulator of flagellin synthesis n=1 Tax=Noviherbaspirillum autotrophicum TaxID=709839 RepID=A0A0C2BLM5_9BURK|nr:flagellar biosynthesis anti-sigma factor FlgM [Noviherbaspirillum autotrophicum]KIF82165.1 flagellar biosynthesis anti-sigma factor FlgM [Noviherbaspirillum autotrophicum]